MKMAGPGGLIDYIRAFTLTVVFILIIACINYMNLATARSAARSREVGIRKATGAHRSQLIFQFIGESLTTTTLSVVLAIVLVQFALPFFNTLMRKNISVDFSSPCFWHRWGVTLLTSVIAGSYPAFSFLRSDRRKFSRVSCNPVCLALHCGKAWLFFNSHCP